MKKTRGMEWPGGLCRPPVLHLKRSRPAPPPLPPKLLCTCVLLRMHGSPYRLPPPPPPAFALQRHWPLPLSVPLSRDVLFSSCAQGPKAKVALFSEQ